ncbi:MAG: hypothetical protein ACFFCS_28085, partial [Candidatus Hodarchaeota archaeon]
MENKKDLSVQIKEETIRNLSFNQRRFFVIVTTCILAFFFTICGEFIECFYHEWMHGLTSLIVSGFQSSPEIHVLDGYMNDHFTGTL